MLNGSRTTAGDARSSQFSIQHSTFIVSLSTNHYPLMLTILCGPARCGKSERLLARYRTALMEQPPGSVLWLAPTWRAAAEVRQRLFEAVGGDSSRRCDVSPHRGPAAFPGCFLPGVMTFEKFAETVLRAARVPMRPITRLMKRELIRQIIGQQAAAGRLKHFRSIATTGGLVELVCEFISELKRLEIWPEQFHRACAARGIGDKDVELSEIYEAYQQALREHGLFDAEGRFWSARDVLQRDEGRGTRDEGNEERERGTGTASRRSPLIPLLSSLSLLVVLDGFTDFTRTQHEIIEILAARAETTIITLPVEQEPRRADLFAKPLKTLAELRRRHGDKLAVEEIAPAGAARLAGDGTPGADAVCQSEGAGGDGERGTRNEESRNCAFSIQHSTFIDPSNPAPSSAGLEILAAARQVGEIELIAGRIKRLLVDGQARPGEIAVVFRSPQDAAELVGEVFGRLGIPVVFESGQRWIVRRRCGRWRRCCNSTWTTGHSINCWPCWAATISSPTGPSGSEAALRPPSSGPFAGCKSPAAESG